VQKGTNQPVAGIDVAVVNAPVRPVRTDAEGRFRFEGLAPGRYGLSVSPVSGYRAKDSVIVIRGNEAVTGIEIIALAEARMSGTVRDPTGRPAAGLRVSALRLHGSGTRFPPDRPPLGVSVTDQAGNYKLAGLAPGVYTVLVEVERSEVSRREWQDGESLKLPEPVRRTVRTYYPSAVSLDQAGSFEVQEGQVLQGVDIRLARPETFCVRSRVRSVAGTAGEKTRLTVSSEAFLGGLTFAEGEMELGAGFEVCGLPAGSYSLLVSPKESGRNGSFAFDTFTLTDRSLRLPDLTLQPLIRLTGRLMVDARAGDVKPFPSPARIHLSAIGRPSATGERTSANVAEPGPFVIPALLPAEYWLRVLPPAGFYVQSAAVDGRDALRAPLHAAGRELVVVLGQDGAQLTVTVAGPRGEPLASPAVIVGRDPLPASYAPGDLAVAVADQYGQAVWTGLAPGSYRVVAFAETMVDPANAAALFQTSRVKGEELTLGPGQKRALSVRPVDRKD
jgi:hypothetical protein